MESRALLPDPNFTYSTKIKCFATNNLLNQILICDKEKLSVFAIESNKILRSLAYYETFFQIYQRKIKATAVEALVLHNLWVLLVDKRHFVFFDLDLNYTRVYRGEQDKATMLRSVQRFDQLVTIKSDRKSFKFWKFEFLDLEARNSARKAETSAKKWLKQDLMAKRYLQVRKEVQTTICDYAHAYPTRVEDFSMTIIITQLKLIHLNGREIMQLEFSEEMKVFVISFGDLEIAIYDLESYEKISSLDVFSSKVTVLESEGYEDSKTRIAAISINQEMLYATDSVSLIVYDLVARHIVRSVQIGKVGTVASLACSNPTVHGGLFFVTTENLLHTFSIKDQMSIHKEKLSDMPLFHIMMKPKISLHGLQSTNRSSQNWLGLRSVESKAKSPTGTEEAQPRSKEKRNNVLLESEFPFLSGFYRFKHKLAFVRLPSGRVKILLTYFRFLRGFDVLHVGACIHETPAGLSQALVLKDDKTPERYQNDTTLILGTCNHKFYAFNLVSQHETGSLSINGMEMWLDAYTACMDKGFAETMRQGVIFYSSFLDLDQKLLVMLTKKHLHLIFFGDQISSKMIAPYDGGQVVACLIIPKWDKSTNEPLPDENFVLVQNEKYDVYAYESHWYRRHFTRARSFLATKVAGMRHIKRTNCLLTITMEGSVDIYQMRESIQLSWRKYVAKMDISSAAVSCDAELIWGSRKGDLQLLNIHWERQEIVQSAIYRYYNTEISCISVCPTQIQEFVVLSKNRVATLWTTTKYTPLKVFFLPNAIQSLSLEYDHMDKEFVLLFVQQEKLIRLSSSTGSDSYEETKNKIEEWWMQVDKRNRFIPKSVKDKKNGLHPALQEGIENLKVTKIQEAFPTITPMFNKIVMNENLRNGRSSLELDFMRMLYDPFDEGATIWIIDPVFDKMCDKGDSIAHQEPNIGPKSSVVDILSKKVSDRVKIDIQEKSDDYTYLVKNFPLVKGLLKTKVRSNIQASTNMDAIRVLNELYEGSNSYRQQMEFLEKNCGIKTEKLDPEYMQMARSFYYKEGEKYLHKRELASRQGTRAEFSKSYSSGFFEKEQVRPLSVPKIASTRLNLRSFTPNIEERAQSRSNLGDTMGNFRIKIKRSGPSQDEQLFDQPAATTERNGKDTNISALPISATLSPEKMRCSSVQKLRNKEDQNLSKNRRESYDKFLARLDQNLFNHKKSDRRSNPASSKKSDSKRDEDYIIPVSLNNMIDDKGDFPRA